MGELVEMVVAAFWRATGLVVMMRVTMLVSVGVRGHESTVGISCERRELGPARRLHHVQLRKSAQRRRMVRTSWPLLGLRMVCFRVLVGVCVVTRGYTPAYVILAHERVS